MSSYDYRVTVRGEAFEAFDVVATRPAVAATRALDFYQRAHRGERTTRLFVELERLGVHKRPPCEATCGLAVPLEEAAASRYGTHYCGRPCTGLENHRTVHRCAEHGGAGSIRPPRGISMDPYQHGAPRA